MKPQNTNDYVYQNLSLNRWTKVVEFPEELTPGVNLDEVISKNEESPLISNDALKKLLKKSKRIK
jgi:hypothetical protein